MVGSATIFFSLFCLLLLLVPYPSSSLPLCIDSRAPVVPKTPLAFCPYNGSVCCNSAKDSQLHKQFQAMDISDPTCASLVQSILCATCDRFSAVLFKISSGPRPIPVLCNSTSPVNSSLSNQAATASSFCSLVWDACQNVSILNSPFAPSLQGSAGGVPVNSTSSKLTDLWQSKTDFCYAFGGSSDDGSICFDGEPVSLNKTETSVPPPKGMCLEKIGNGSYINMVPHPDGSNRAFFSNQLGKIWLDTIPEQGSGEIMGVDESSPFVDLTDLVYLDTTLGMLGMAFHPDFASNGRFFASYNCDKFKFAACSGRCSCNSDVNCDPSKVRGSNAAQSCQYHTVVAEFTANGTAEPSMATSAKPSEVRRIFTMGLPFTNNHGGQILFGPADGYLYLMMGDGGNRGDPYNFARNKKSLLGKIMRLDINDIPILIVHFDQKTVLYLKSEDPYVYSYLSNKALLSDQNGQCGLECKILLLFVPEIWALGFREPWRCSFDSERPPYFLCADVGQDKYEEVDLITKGGNYGWNHYEGPIRLSSEKNTSTNITNLISPILGYSHSDINTNEESAVILGGYIYRSATDPCMYGSYVYGDLYAGAIWAAAETPESSGNFTSTKIPFGCARNSPVQCSLVPESNLPALVYIHSFGEDNRKDVYILTRSGVYRVVAPSRCNYTCSKETVTTAMRPGPSSPSSSYRNQMKKQQQLLLSLPSLLIILSFLF